MARMATGMEGPQKVWWTWEWLAGPSRIGHTETKRVRFCIDLLLGFWRAAAEASRGSTAVARGLCLGFSAAIGDVLPGAGGSQVLRVSEEVGHWLSESQAKWWKSREVLESYGRSGFDGGVGGLVEGMVALCMLQGVAEQTVMCRERRQAQNRNRMQPFRLKAISLTSLSFSYAIARRAASWSRVEGELECSRGHTCMMPWYIALTVQGLCRKGSIGF